MLSQEKDHLLSSFQVNQLVSKPSLLFYSSEENNKLNVFKDNFTILSVKLDTDILFKLNENFNNISLIILDLQDAQDEYLTVLQTIRSIALYNHIPIIALSTNKSENVYNAIYKNGANAFLFKPYSEDTLLSTINNLIVLCHNSAKKTDLKYDRLTGLYNRTTFFLEAKKAIQEKENGYYCLTCFDISNFKVINDLYGADAGDRLLKHIANTIASILEMIGGICCRYTADRFALLFPAKYIDSKVVLENFKTVTNPPFLKQNVHIRRGRCIVNNKMTPIQSLFDRASLAEESIKNRYDVLVAEFDESMRTSILQEQKITSLMHDALKNGEFEPWFQPQYNHETGKIIGAEALIRWKQEDGTYIQPGSFIPVFEKNGFVYEVDKFVWETSCILLRKWLDAKKSPPAISVNISRFDIFAPDFFKVITSLVKKYEIPIDLLRLEITESAFSMSSNQIVTMMKKLIEYGFTVEIDDFGSGYSSLNTLKDVPAQVLKMDMKFLENNSDTIRSGNILESIVRMAKWLGMSVIAEGVEQKEQADYLNTIGCYLIQGYFYSKPLPLYEYEKLIEKQKACLN